MMFIKGIIFKKAIDMSNATGLSCSEIDGAKIGVDIKSIRIMEYDGSRKVERKIKIIAKRK